jgi:hypothetical protein
MAIDTCTRYKEAVNEGGGARGTSQINAGAEERVGTCSLTQLTHNARNKYQHRELNVQMTNSEGE